MTIFGDHHLVTTATNGDNNHGDLKAAEMSEDGPNVTSTAESPRTTTEGTHDAPAKNEFLFELLILASRVQ
jgi:hypothetical protein